MASSASSSADAALSAAMQTLDRAHSDENASSANLHCCCGRPDCALLKKNSSVLETVEKDVHTAAQLGQALLARHEAYMADAERDRLELTSRIERLEIDKKELEADNASKIEENRNLLDQLENLNNTVSESDTKIKALEASLLSSQQAVRRLEGAASRAADAERHLAVLEEEQLRLRGELLLSKEDARSHAQRCKEAERGILDVQDQLERMEDEGRKERERHAEVVGRMERQREVEKQLDAAAGRLKSAAASKGHVNGNGPNQKPGGNETVGHFVRDLLEDNANLQLGIAELREMLMNSNDEIQNLREQLMYHQPVLDEDRSATPTLKDELEPADPQPPESHRISQELHIHHHYHVSPKQDLRKNKKKRQGLTPGTFTPPAAITSVPATPSRGGHYPLSSPTAPALLSSPSRRPPPQALTIAPHSFNGFSNPPSEFAPSIPSSPQSTRHDSMMFDPVFSDAGPPTSPATTFDPMSPTWAIHNHKKRPSEVSTRSFQSMSQLESVPGSPPPVQMSHQKGIDSTIHEVDEEAQTSEDLAGSTEDCLLEDSCTEGGEERRLDDSQPQPRLYRTVSHESIMSLTGGLDIHTLKARPSQMTLRPLGGAEAILTGVTAQPTLSRGSAKRSDVALRDHFAGFSSPRAVSSPMSARVASPSPSRDSDEGVSGTGFSRLVGWRPWGGGAPSAARNTPSAAADKQRDKDWSRSTGINQAGSIPGFAQYWATQKRKGAPAQVTTDTVDRLALSEGLLE